MLIVNVLNLAVMFPAWLVFGSLKKALYDPDSSVGLADTVLHQLKEKSLLDVRIPTWSDQAEKLDNFIQQELTGSN